MDLSKAKAVFFEESRELCDALETALLDPVSFPPNVETYNLLFRTAHTIKGSAGIFGLDALVRFAHVVENVLERLRSGQVALSEDLISLLLSCNDHLRRLLDSAGASDDMALEDLPEGEPLLHSLRQYQSDAIVAPQPLAAPTAVREAGSARIAAQTPHWQLSLRFHPDTFRHGFDPLSFLRYLAAWARCGRWRRSGAIGRRCRYWTSPNASWGWTSAWSPTKAWNASREPSNSSPRTA
ncbi:Hpt domain-containing protein [Chromobacterium sphagni]|uniref:Hpt domain-containing protein n=1 Tax=Chromobacterium sphagni TaxID=1903179 RepID=UPI000A50DDC7|nr:Hpt domain-containing protein [Chromobacterium sphagni]